MLIKWQYSPITIKPSLMHAGLPAGVTAIGYVPKDLVTHGDTVDYWLTCITKQAIANGLKPFYCDMDRA